MPHPILLYDGVCGLCHRLVQFVLRRDPSGIFRFASLQSPLAEHVLRRHGVEVRDLNSVYVIVDHQLPGERVLSRSDAVIYVLKQLAAPARLRSAGQLNARVEAAEGATVSSQPDPAHSVPTRSVLTHGEPRLGRWGFAALVLELIPRPLRELGYRLIARNRYRIFGRYESCLLPASEDRGRFLDL